MEWGTGDGLKARSYGQANEYVDSNDRVSQNGGKESPNIL